MTPARAALWFGLAVSGTLDEGRESNTLLIADAEAEVTTGVLLRPSKSLPTPLLVILLVGLGISVGGGTLFTTGPSKPAKACERSFPAATEGRFVVAVAVADDDAAAAWTT